MISDVPVMLALPAVAPITTQFEQPYAPVPPPLLLLPMTTELKTLAEVTWVL